MSGDCKKERGKKVEIIIIDKIIKVQYKEAVHRGVFCVGLGTFSHHWAANKRTILVLKSISQRAGSIWDS